MSGIGEYNINIAIFGPVSAGKSTLTNAIFVEQFSDMRIKRTTALPQVYEEVLSKKDTCDLSKIREANRKKNTEIMSRTENSETPLTLDEIEEIRYKVPKMFDMDILAPHVLFNVYDTPGLNDSKTQSVYFEYVKKNIFKMDVIILVFDIMSAMNTSDDVAILDLILAGIRANRELGINTRLLIILNKCDEMIFNKGFNRMEPQDEELLEMMTQVENIVNEKANVEPAVDVQFTCLAAEDAYIYRMLDRDPKCELDIKYINKLGHNEFGRSKWNRMSPQNRQVKIRNFFKKNGSAESIEFSGFGQFKKILSTILTKENQLEYIINHITYEMNQITDHTKQDISYELNSLIAIRQRVDRLFRLFKIKQVVTQNKYYNVIDDYTNKFVKSYESHNKQIYDETALTSEQLSTSLTMKKMWSTIHDYTVGTPFKKIKSRFIQIINHNTSSYCEKMIQNTASSFEEIEEAFNNLTISASHIKTKSIVIQFLSTIHKYSFVNSESFKYSRTLHTDMILRVYEYVCGKCGRYKIAKEVLISVSFILLLSYAEDANRLHIDYLDRETKDFVLMKRLDICDRYRVRITSPYYRMFEQYRTKTMSLRNQLSYCSIDQISTNIQLFRIGCATDIPPIFEETILPIGEDILLFPPIFEETLIKLLKEHVPSQIITLY